MKRAGVPPQWASSAASLGLLTLSAFLTIGIISYSPEDISVLSFPVAEPINNLAGTLGAWSGLLGRGVFGWGALVLPLLCLLWAVRLWQGRIAEMHAGSIALATVSFMASMATLLSMSGSTDAIRAQAGGLAGFLLAGSGSYYLGVAGTILTAGCVAVLSWLVVSGSPLQLPKSLSFNWLTRWLGFLRPRTLSEKNLQRAEGAPAPARLREPTAESGLEDAQEKPRGLLPRMRSTVKPPKAKPIAAALPRRQLPGGFQLPSMDLLTTPPPVAQREISEDSQTHARILIETLREFGIEAQVTNIDRGPTVTRFEIMPAPGVKLTKIVALSDDIALVMKAASCHIVAPIPGKGTVGIDVPNTITTTVYLKEIITQPEFANHPSPIALPIGKDVSGHAIITDLRDCPHLLIAGATGSGKTVCLNSVLIGMMMHASPDQVKFLMVDPKMVELAMFNEIPHLVAPVVTSAKKAAVAIAWAVGEMERRYQLLARAGTRNIDGYNKRIVSGEPLPKTNDPLNNPEGDEGPEDDGRPLPYLVIVIDELADLMMVAAQDVEGAITRLAQLSRAVGIHMILATQRPSVDVITGVIKANFPARIAFQVASKVDSRTILDVNGADKLLGRGDLLFLRPGTAKPIRAQGAFLTDAEIEKVTTVLKQQQKPVYDASLLEKARQPDNALGSSGGEHDELYETAKQLILDTGQASTSFLQRRLRLGYGRAARLLDQMEQEGIIGPAQGSRPREVLVARDIVQGGTKT